MLPQSPGKKKSKDRKEQSPTAVCLSGKKDAYLDTSLISETERRTSEQ